jgi:hypothetical protein
MGDEIKRLKLSDSQLKSEILSFFSEGKTGKTDLFGLIRINYTIGRDRYFKVYDETYSVWAKLKEVSEKDAIVASAGDALKSGLKSKIEKQLHLQKAIDEIQADIDRGISEEYIFENGVYTLQENIMTAQTKAYLRKTIKELYAELNKMEGDYAPNQVGHTFNNPLPLTATKEEIKKIANALDNIV